MPRTILQVRKGWCNQVAQELSDYFTLACTAFDIDEAARLIDLRLPTTYDEYLVELEEICKEVRETGKARKAGSAGAQLRQVLGVTEKVSLMDCLLMAVERLKGGGASKKTTNTSSP